MLTSNITLNYNTKIENADRVEKLISEALKKSFSFFGQQILNFTITFLYSREEMDKVVGRKTEDWLVGYTKNKNIYIFSPFVFAKVSSHQPSDFKYALAHEIAHIFNNEFIGLVYPRWLVEGLSGYIAGQNKIRPVDKITNFSLLHNSFSWSKNFNYPQSYSFTNFLINKIGKKKALTFFKKIPKTIGKYNRQSDFNRFFKEELSICFEEFVKLWETTV